ncbi:uncharacterized protein LOC115225349 isoform X3 [Octopus sinensis]|uniref:Uncharacterized protein LOC115225349 isoform X3 n=1 Tax=Octopus sinensis TaxID=2607531 RepID=A0A7E6FQY6_9MOLL|nr:uncharacterized protein LOC115225349 isoform X3 [Octopus sinensis]
MSGNPFVRDEDYAVKMFRNPLVYLNKSSNALVVDDDDDDDDWEKENYGSGLGDKQVPDCQDKLGPLDSGATDIIGHRPDHHHCYPEDDDGDDADDDNDIVCMRRELDVLLGRTGPSKRVTVHTSLSRQHRRFLADIDDNVHGRLTTAADSGQMSVPQKATAKENKGTKTSKLKGDAKDKEGKKAKRGESSAEETKKGKGAVKTNMEATRRKDVGPAMTSGDEDVIERGAGREVTKGSRQPNNKTSVTTPPGHSLPSIDERLSQLRPSRELLEFYRKKIAEYNEEHTGIVTHIDAYKETYEEMGKLQWEIRQREGEIVELQQALSDMQLFLYQEKDHVLRLYAENDRLKLRELEDKQKIQHLLSLGGYPEGEVTYFHKEPPAMAIIEQKYSKSENQGMKKKKSCEAKCLCESLRQDNKILSMQIERLQSQLEEQTKNSKEHIASLFADRYEKQMEEEARRKRDERKIEVLLENAPVPEKEGKKMMTSNDTTTSNNTTSHRSNFASAAKQSSEEVNVTMEEIKNAMELLRKEGNSVFLNTPQQLIHDTNKKTILYKVFDKKNKRLINATPQQLEIALKPIWGKKSYVTRGRRFGTVEVRCPTEEDARAHAISPLQTESLLLVPTYLGQQVTKITQCRTTITRNSSKAYMGPKELCN